MSQPADELVATTIVATLDAPLEQGKSTVFCSTFQLAWSELRDLLGAPLELEGDPPLAASLEVGGPSKDDVDAASCLARAGEGPPFLEALGAELHAQFGDGDFALPPRLGQTDLLAYAYLAKDLQFVEPFDVERTAGLVFDGVVLPAFGVWPRHEAEKWAARASQITVHDYESDDDFVVELATKATGDRLILAKTRPGATLGVTVASTLARVREKASMLQRLTGSTKFGADDVLKVPLVHLDVVRKYTELCGRLIEGNRLGGVVGDARQAIRFRLDERGAILRSSASIEVLRSAPVAKRKLIFDAPFLLAIRRTDRKLPYLAMWVANPELLAKAEG